ncbi:MAG TPA: ATP synthase subunit I [Desulfobacteraceae bacterium]|nr:ATP synthase subunit I [Desulfobacteraceae bacterium]
MIMNKLVDLKNTDAAQEAAGVILLRYVQHFNWLLLAVLTAGSWSFSSWLVAQSVLFGGLLANGSFFLLRRDIQHLITNVSEQGQAGNPVTKQEKIKFFLKFYGRLIALVAVLFLLFTCFTINTVGLLIGLSTVMLSVIIVVLSKGRMLYSVQGLKGA